MHLHYRHSFIVLALLIAGLATLVVPHHRASATVPPPPTCTDPRPGGQTYPATAFLTAPGTLVGTSGRDVLVGSTGNDVINGLGGDDLICSNGGSDTIDAGSGNDVVFADPYPVIASSQVKGGPGDDWMQVQGNGHGDAGNDHLAGGLGTLWGDAGNDYVYENGGIAAYGGAGNDEVHAIATSIGDGGSGDDYVHGSYENTALIGGSGNDTLVNDNNPSVGNLNGGSGTDTCTPVDAPTRLCETLT